MSRSNFYKNYYQSFMNENMNPLYRRYLEYLSSDLPDVSNIGGFIDVPTTAEREGLESLLDTTEDVRTPLGPMAPMNQQRGGGDGPRGTGRFGNLDPDSRRKVLIDGVLTDVYTNLTSGLTQTYDGKNVKGGIETIFDPSNPGGVTLATDGDDDGYDYDYSTFGPSVLGFGASPFSLDKRKEAAITNQFEHDRKVQEAEEKRKAAAAREKAAAEAAKREAQRKQIQDLQNKIDQGQYGGGGGGGTGSGGRGTTSNPGRDPGSYGGGRDMGSTSSGGYGSGKDRGSSLHG